MARAENELLLVTDSSPYLRHGADGLPVLGGVHRVLPQVVGAVEQIAYACDLRFTHASTVAQIPNGILEKVSVLALFTIGETPWTDEQRRLIERRVQTDDLHLLVLHSASDASAGWPEYGDLIGARFDGHPWTTTFDVDVCDTDHPATRMLPQPWAMTDEVYLFRDLRPDAQILLTANANSLSMDVTGARVPSHGLPLAWCFQHASGRVFYSALGHFPEAYEDVNFLGHLRGGLLWLLDHS